MPKGRPRGGRCACTSCAGGDVEWERIGEDGLGLVRCDCGQWVEHGAYWAHRASDDVG